MTHETLATVTGNADRIRQFVEKSALLGSGSDPYHEEIYLNIQDGQVNSLASSAGNSAISYCSFAEGYLDDVSTEQEGGTQAIIDVADFLTFFEMASDGKYAEIRFQGSPDDDLATSVVVESKLESTIMLPVSESVKEKIPLGVVDRFQQGEKWDSPHVFFSNQGNEPATQISTPMEELQIIVDAAENTGKEFFPISVEEEELNVAVEQDAGGHGLKGGLPADVEGADVANNYLHGFEELISSISGDSVLRTAPDAPVSVIKDGDGYVLRHVLAPVK